jgi:hypothetical protein
MELDNLLENVNSKESFLEFVLALKKDRIDEVEKEKIFKSNPYGQGANGWQNGTIEGYLDSLHAYGKSSLVDNTPNWKTFALLLYAGKFYE